MAKGPYDDIVRAVLERLGAKAPKAATGTGKRTAKKAASTVAKPMTKAERSAANRAAHAAKQQALNAERAAARPAEKAARTAENKAKGVARANRKAEEAYGYGASPVKRQKAYAFYEKEVEKLNRTIDATERLLSKGSQGRRDMLKKELDRFKKRYDVPKLSAGDSLGVVRGAIEKAQKNNAWAKKRLEALVKQTESKTWKETVDMGSRRARAIEIKTGKVVTGQKPAYMTRQEKDLQKRLNAQLEKQEYEKVIKKADSKMGAARGSQPKKPKKVVEQESSKRLRAAQDKNAKKGVIDPRVAKMTPAQRKKFLAEENKKWKAIKDRSKISQSRMSDTEAKEKLAKLGKSEMVSDKRKLGPYPTTDRYGRYSGKR